MKEISAVTLFVEDLEAARRFYKEVFGLVEPAHLASPDAGARMQFTIEVDDVDAKAAELQSRGVELLNGPMDRPWGVRTASFRDLGEHIWEIAKNIRR